MPSERLLIKEYNAPFVSLIFVHSILYLIMWAPKYSRGKAHRPDKKSFYCNKQNWSDTDTLVRLISFH
jgi:hypothetical protein